FQQRADAAAPVVGNRMMALLREGEFLVLGADPKLRLGLAAGFEPRDQLLTRFDRRHVDLVTSHSVIPEKGRGPYPGAGKAQILPWDQLALRALMRRSALDKFYERDVILTPNRNIWRLERAERAAILIDAARYS